MWHPEMQTTSKHLIVEGVTSSRAHPVKMDRSFNNFNNSSLPHPKLSRCSLEVTLQRTALTAAETFGLTVRVLKGVRADPRRRRVVDTANEVTRELLLD